MIQRIKLFGNPENKKKRKEWEAQEGRKRYDRLTNSGMDEGGNKIPDSDLVKNTKETLKNSDVEARKTYRNIEHLNGNNKTTKSGVGSELYHGVRNEAQQKATKPKDMFEIFDRVDDRQYREEIGNISKRELDKANLSRKANHTLSQNHTTPVKAESILKPRKSISKQVGSIFTKLLKKRV